MFTTILTVGIFSNKKSFNSTNLYTFYIWKPFKRYFQSQISRSIFSIATNWKDLTYLGKTSPVWNPRECILSLPLENPKEGLGRKKKCWYLL